MKFVDVNVDQMQVFVMINNVGMKTNADVNANNVIKGLFGILVIVNMNVINHVILENIQIMKIENGERGQKIHQSKNVINILMKLIWEE